MLPVDPVALAEVCRRYGIATLAVFGSVARDEESADSDVDLLYELRPGARLGWPIADLVDELSALWGRPADLVARVAVHPRLRRAVLDDATLVHARDVLLVEEMTDAERAMELVTGTDPHGHRHWSVDFSILHTTATDQLPGLVTALRAVLDGLDHPGGR